MILTTSDRTPSYDVKHRDWACPGTRCNFTLRTQPTHYAPSHYCNPNARSTHHWLVPFDQEVTE